jgi:hypothetical protein
MKGSLIQEAHTLKKRDHGGWENPTLMKTQSKAL